MQLRHVLAEILQARDRPGALLNFIQNQEGLPRDNCLFSDDTAQFIQNPPGLIIVVKDRLQGVIFLKIEVSDIFKFFLSESADGIGFPALTQTCDQKRFSVIPYLPFPQPGCDLSFQSAIPLLIKLTHADYTFFRSNNQVVLHFFI